MSNKHFLTLVLVMVLGLFSVAYADTVILADEQAVNVADAESAEAAEASVAQPPVVEAPKPAPVPEPIPKTGEALGWYDTVNSFMPVGSDITIIDLWTGKKFKARRTYGHNHADMETLSLQDTLVMKSIWGGSWNWDRRPVLVQFQGRTLAASAAGMPHAGLDSAPELATVKGRSGGFGRGMNLDAVKGNGMDGHFDLHFLGSRTHGSNRVDAKHQQMVKVAAGQ